MNQLTSLPASSLVNIRGGGDSYARDYGQFVGGVIGTYANNPLTFIPGLSPLGAFIAVGYGLWAASN